jgi:hypothetical protein
MKLKLVVLSMFAVAAVVTSSLALGAAKDLDSCCTPADQDWPTVSGNLGQQSYTSLSQITKANINTLGPAWIVHVSAVPATTPTASPGTTNGGQQTSPIAVDGVVYSETPDGDVIAVDGATGAVKWKWHPTTANSGFGPTGTRRGLAVGGGRVYTLAAGNRVVALNQQTGAQIWAVVPAPPAGETTLGNIAKVATMYYNGRVYIFTNDGNRNAAFALDAATGAMAWTSPFYGGAKPGLTVTDVNGKTWFAGDTWMCEMREANPAPQAPRRTPVRYRRCLAVDPRFDRSRAQHGLCCIRQRAELRLVPGLFGTPGRQPVLRLAGGDGRDDRRLQMALPVEPAWPVGHGQHPQSNDGRRHHRRPAEEGDLLRHEAGQNVRDRSHHWLAGAAG